MQTITVRLTVLAVLSISLISPMSHSVLADHVEPAYEPGALLVKFQNTLSEQDVQDLLNKAHLKSQSHIGRGRLGHLHRLKIPVGHEHSTIQWLRSRAEVEYAELNSLVEASGNPGDPSFPTEWHLPDLSAPQAWEMSTGLPTMTIAVLDTGVDPTHPDLIPNLIPGYNFYDGNSDTTDVQGHGTGVAGAAAMAGGNGIGGVGVCYDCSILPVRIAFNNNGGAYAYYSTIAEGVQWAADQGARIQNISFGGIAASAAIRDAAQYAHDHGSLVFGAAGNEGLDPGLAQNPNLIMIGATDPADTKTKWSNFGDFLTLTAPGLSVFTTYRGGGYGPWSGTSVASPVAAGVAALAWSANPALTNDQVRDLLIASADDLGTPGWDPLYGFGKVNAARAVAAAVASLPVSDAFGTAFNGQTPSLPGRVEAENFNVGGEGVAYHDDSAGNYGGSYRQEDVDIEASSDLNGGSDIGWISPGEWLAYSVTATQTRTYTLTMRVARRYRGPSFAHLEIDGVDVTGPVTIPSTGGWQNFTSVTAAGIPLRAGPHVIRVVMDGGGFNFNWFSID